MLFCDLCLVIVAFVHSVCKINNASMVVMWLLGIT